MNKISKFHLNILEFLSFLKKQNTGDKISFEKFKTYWALCGLPSSHSTFNTYFTFLKNLGIIIIMSNYNKLIKINQEEITKFINFVKQNYELNQHTLILLRDIEASE